jgi:serralysin
VADPTITGGQTVSVTDLPPSSAAAVGDAFATLNGLKDANGAAVFTDSVILSDLSMPPSNEAQTLSVYTVSGDAFVNSVASVPDGNSAVILSGTADARVFGNADATNQLIVGNAGNDVINSGGGSGTIIAGDGNNVIGTLASGSGDVLIKTGNGDNTIVAASGNNTIITGTGNNLVSLGTGNNLAYVQGNDTLTAGAGNQTLGAGAGNVTMFAGTGQSTLIGGSGNDQLFTLGGSGNVVVAGTGNTTIQGGTGDNTFIGGNASTTNALILGGSGNETIFGGAGHETLNGGGGSNLFAFTADGSLGGGNNVIGDFNAATDHLGFLGYGSASQILANSTVVSGNTQISLTDGTKITLIGITNLNPNNVVAG